MALYTFLHTYSGLTSTFSITADDMNLAIQNWIKEELPRHGIKGCTPVTYADIDLVHLEKNVWITEFQYAEKDHSVHIIKTSEQAEPFYDFKEVADFIFENINIDRSPKIKRKIIAMILNFRFEYMKQLGVVHERNGVDYVEGFDIQEEDEIKFINLKGLEAGVNLTNECIEAVLEWEYEFMDNNGMIEEDKINLFGLDFQVPGLN